MADNVVSNSTLCIYRSCKKVKKASINWAIVTAIRDFNKNTIPTDPYNKPELKEERAAYIKKINELRNKT